MPDSPQPEMPPGETRPAYVVGNVDGNQDDSTRNLVLGVVFVVLGIPIAGFALIWAGKEAFVALATAVVLGLVSFLANQAHLTRQRNGLFLLLSLGLILTVSIPVGVKLFLSGPEFPHLTVEFNRSQQAAVAALPSSPVPVTVAAPSPVPAPSVAPAVETAVKPAQKPTEIAPVSEPQLPKASDAQLGGPIEKTAEKPPTSPVAPSESRPDEDPVQRATRLAKDEAIKRYPKLTVPGSSEHSLYLEAYNELARLRKFEFFKDPQWPLKLAESVAQREGWARADLPAADSGKSTVKPATKTPMPLPGEDLPLDGPQAAVPADPVAQATNRAIIEVRRRYPALGKTGSPENVIYLEAYKELERLRPDFFEKPEWPIHLAEIVAKREGWRRHDSGEATVENPAAAELPLPK